MGPAICRLLAGDRRAAIRDRFASATREAGARTFQRVALAGTIVYNLFLFLNAVDIPAGASITQLIQATDATLYRAKQAGRNQVQTAAAVEAVEAVEAAEAVEAVDAGRAQAVNSVSTPV